MIDGSGPCCPARERRARGLWPRTIFFVAGLTVAAAFDANAATIRWRAETTPNAIDVEGLAADALAAPGRDATGASGWSRVFAVFAEPVEGVPGGKAMPPMAGAWRIEGGRLRFEPRFPLVHGVRYRAEYRPAVGPPVISFFELPAVKNRVPTEVVQVYPTVDVLPENQLKFYVHFSAPMARGRTYEHIHVRDAGGQIIDLPFLDLDEELWDLPMTRLTLLIDPGRIKRGVKPLEDIGPVFESGKAYTLTIETACRDAAGQPLRTKFEKTIRVAVADRSPPDPNRWKIQAPAAGARAPLVVEFDEPMDQALALRLIRVATGGEAINGEATLGRHERSWTFIPSLPWKKGKHHLTIATTIEDLAGNNIGKAFDVDVAAQTERRPELQSINVGFDVK